MTLHQLRRLYSLGMLKEAKVITAPDSAGWTLELTSQSGSVVSMSKTRTDKEGIRNTRIFNSIDAACSSANEIGFSNVIVALPKKEILTEEFTLT